MKGFMYRKSAKEAPSEVYPSDGAFYFTQDLYKWYNFNIYDIRMEKRDS